MMLRYGLIVGLLLLLCTRAGAVILSNKRALNTGAPTGAFANAGWQYQGEWQGFLGTAISVNTFITAEHVGGSVGDFFTFAGRRYKVTAGYDDPDSDLQIWHIRGRLPAWAPLNRTLDETGKTAMIFGRGTLRGGEVNLNGQLKGWFWGAPSGVTSWGMNQITASTAGKADAENGGARLKGTRLFWTFDRNGLRHEGALSPGDSGGGVFVQSGGKWVLAGVNYATQGDFAFPGSNVIEHAALLDFGGLNAGSSVLEDAAEDIPSRQFATRIGTRMDWITDVLSGQITPSASATPAAGVPEPSSPTLVAVATFGMLLRRRRCRSF
jgi:hypothetical protein